MRGWQTSRIRPDRYDRLTELRDVVLVLAESLTPRGVGQWLHARNRLLDGRRPFELLQMGDIDEVRRAAAAFVDGSYI